MGFFKDTFKKTATKKIKKIAKETAENIVLEGISNQMKKRKSETLLNESQSIYQLIIKHKGNGKKPNYVVCNDSNNIQYKIKTNSIPLKKESLKLFDNQDNEIAEVKPKMYNKEYVDYYILYTNNEKLGNATFKLSLKTKIIFSFNNWYVEGKQFGKEYNVFDETENTIIKINSTTDEKETYLIEYNSKNDELFSLLTFMTIKLNNYFIDK